MAMTSTPAGRAPRPLDGIRVLEMGQLIAGPFAGSVLGYFGAEVIKLEPPAGGDPLRQWRVLRDGTSLWWRSLARNKKCVGVDLRQEEGRALAKRLAERSDVLIENFRPGTMEKWGLGPDGPYASRPGFASVCEGIGGLRYVNGHPGEPPVRPNLSLGDTLAGLHAVIGILLALIQRGKASAEALGGGKGQVVDVAIYESVFNVLEGVVAEYDGAGVVREPSGSTLTGIVPTGTYPCRDGAHVIIGGNNDSIFRRLMRAMGRDDLADDPRLARNPGRVEHQAEVDGAITAWTSRHDAAEVLAVLEEAAVPSGPIYSVAHMFADPHFQARGLFEHVEVDGRELRVPALMPRLADTPGGTDWAGPELGSHDHEVLREVLGLDDETLRGLAARGVVGGVP